MICVRISRSVYWFQDHRRLTYLRTSEPASPNFKAAYAKHGSITSVMIGVIIKFVIDAPLLYAIAHETDA